MAFRRRPSAAGGSVATCGVLCCSRLRCVATQNKRRTTVASLFRLRPSATRVQAPQRLHRLQQSTAQHGTAEAESHSYRCGLGGLAGPNPHLPAVHAMCVLVDANTEGAAQLAAEEQCVRALIKAIADDADAVKVQPRTAAVKGPIGSRITAGGLRRSQHW